MIKSKTINQHLIGQNILALYSNGEFSTTDNLRDGWIMLIDIGRHRHTIVSNPKTTPDAIEFCGQFWEPHDAEYTGTYLIVDDDWMVHQSVKATEEDFVNVKEGVYGGIMEMTERFYMSANGDFITVDKSKSNRITER